MRVLIIGGTGFIGSHIVRQIAAEGHTVTIFHRGQTKAELPKGVCEIVDAQSVLPITKFPNDLLKFEPEVVIHTFAMGEADTHAAVETFRGRAGRFVLLSSGDVYRAYGRFTGIEPGPIEGGLLSETAPLRTVLFPYRKKASSPSSLEHWYEKILAEKEALRSTTLPGTVLRLPKVYGRGNNANLATVYSYRHRPNWRWTHGYVENVAAAIALAATHPSGAGRVYNVGEAYTPTVDERLAWMPESSIPADVHSEFNFAQNIAYDTTRIRSELGYRDIVPEKEAMLRILAAG